MTLGNADMRAKICAVQAKYCLILLCVDHVLAALLTIGAVLYVYLSAPLYIQLKGGYLLLLIPGVLALFTGIGAIGCLLVKRKLIMIICIAWPVLVCIAATFFYGVMIYTLSTWNGSGNGNPPILMSTTELVLSMLGVILIPLSCCCCVVLGCLGCCIKSPEESSKGSNGSKGFKGSVPGEGAMTTPDALKSKQGNKMNPNGMNGNNQGNGQKNGNGGMMNQNQNQNQMPNNQNQNQNNQNPNLNQMQNQNPNNQNWNQNPNQNQMANNQNWNGNQVQGRPNQGNQQANNGGVNNQGMHHKNHSQHFWN